MTERQGPDPFGIDQAPPADGVGLCLSGGGYRAMLFHLGALRFLNEAGWLPKLTRVASVSGGSITAGIVGLAWKDLAFNANGVATRFTDLVERPILLLASSTIDIPAVLTGLWPGRIADRVARAYDKALFHGATLQDLPADADGPRFILLATDLSNATLWRFSKPYMRTWRSKPILNPALGLAKAVASSSAFPPVLSPSLLKVDGRTIYLTDGGVYDNLGLEPVVKRCATVLVSDGGGTFGEAERPARDWLRGTYRILQTVDVEVRRLRRRQVVGLLTAQRRSGAFWAINSDRGDFPAPQGALLCPIGQTTALAHLPTRLAALDESTRQRLVNWGYAVADAGLRSYVDPTLSVPTQFPYPSVGVG
jgi:NTE family protein